MTILLVDDHIILRKSLKEIIKDEFPKCEFLEASNGLEALSIMKKETLSLVLMDITMPKMTGVDVLKEVQVLGLKVPIIILTMQPEDQYALQVLKAGAFGFLNKNSGTSEFIIAIKRVLTGKKYISDRIANILADAVGQKKVKDLHELLSERELQVLTLIAKGRTVSQIAEEIALSVNTVSTYRSRILHKMNLKNNAAIVRYAIDYNII